MNRSELYQKAFLLQLVVVSLAFLWILWPFYGAVFWGAVLAILFAPLYNRLLLSMPRHRSLAALVTLLITLVVVILPLTIITSSLFSQGHAVYESMRSGNLDFGGYFEQVIGRLPAWLVSLLERYDLADVSGFRERLSTAAMQGSQVIAAQALNIGQNTFNFLVGFFIMLYLLFFLLRDGAWLAARIKRAIPLSKQNKQRLLDKFTAVIRATVKGNIAVAAVQGALGGAIFWFLGIQGAMLWGAVMAFLSLLPAVGAAMIWGPVAVYFLATGAIWQGVVLIVFGVLVIGLVDNLLRPLLVGKDTQMPDYVVLVSTVGGMAIFGLNGFVIGPVIAAWFIAAWDLFASAYESQPE